MKTFFVRSCLKKKFSASNSLDLFHNFGNSKAFNTGLTQN